MEKPKKIISSEIRRARNRCANKRYMVRKRFLQHKKNPKSKALTPAQRSRRYRDKKKKYRDLIVDENEY